MLVSPSGRIGYLMTMLPLFSVVTFTHGVETQPVFGTAVNPNFTVPLEPANSPRDRVANVCVVATP